MKFSLQANSVGWVFPWVGGGSAPFFSLTRLANSRLVNKGFVLPSSLAKIRPVEFARRLIEIKLDNEAEINPNLINDYMNKPFANFEG